MNVVVIFVVESSDRDDVVDVICDLDVVDVVIDFVVNAIVDVLVDIVLDAAPVIVGVGDKNIVVILLAVSYLGGEEDC